MVDQGTTSQPYTMRELEVVHLREDDLDGEAVDLRAERPVSRAIMTTASRQRGTAAAPSRDA